MELPQQKPTVRTKIEQAIYRQSPRIFYFQKLFKFLLVITLNLQFHYEISSTFVTLGCIAYFIAKYFVQGNTIVIILLYPAAILFCIGFAFDQLFLQIIAVIISVIGSQFTMKPCKLPEIKKLVGFRQRINQKGKYETQFYPLQQTPEPNQKWIKWNRYKQLDRLCQRFPKILSKIFKFTMSFIYKLKINVGQGIELKTKSLMIFCHGRGSCVMYHSYLLRRMATKRKIVGIQHFQQNALNFKTKQQCKKFRQEQIRVRTQDLIDLLLLKQSQYDEIIIIGHSYGAGTVFNAAQILKQTPIFKKISHLILLDPWFFPVRQQLLQSSIKIPTLTISTQDFVQYKDNHNRLHRFLQHNLQEKKFYHFLLKNSDHIHVTDASFIIGSTLAKKVKYPQRTREVTEIHIQIIEAFLRGQTRQEVQTAVGKQYFLDDNYQPQKLIESKEYF